MEGVHENPTVMLMDFLKGKIMSVGCGMSVFPGLPMSITTGYCRMSVSPGLPMSITTTFKKRTFLLG